MHLKIRTRSTIAVAVVATTVLAAANTVAWAAAPARPAAVSGSLTLDGTPTKVRLRTAGQDGALTFAGTTGQKVSVVLSGSTIGPACPALLVALVRPDNSTLGTPTSTCGADGFVDAQTLDQSGAWTVQLDTQGADSGHVSVQAYAVTDQVGTIVRNAIPVSVTTTVPGQNATFTFSSAAGQQISARLDASTFGKVCGAVNLSLVRPDGSAFGTVAGSCKKAAFLDGQTLDATGIWSVLVDPQGSRDGTASLTAWNTNDRTGLTKLDGSAFAISALNPGQNATIHFSGTSGQKVSALVTHAQFSGCPGFLLSLVRPDGGAFGTPVSTCTTSAFLDATALDEDGVWTILVDPQGQAAGDAQLHAWDASDAAKPITLNGASINAALDPGQNGRYTFTGSVGQEVSAAVTHSTISGCPGFVLELLRPDDSVLGSPVNGCGATAFLDSLTLDRNGTWTILVDPQGAATGNATLDGYTFADDNGAADLSGKPANLDFVRPGQNAAWSFTGTAGSKVSATVTDSTLAPCDYTLSLVRPNGTTFGTPVAGCTADAFLEPQVLDMKGTWSVVVDPQGTAVGEATLRVFSVVDASGKLKPGADLTTFTSLAPGTNAGYRITGTAGDVRTVTISSSTYSNGACPDIVVTLVRPDASVRTQASTCTASLTLSKVTIDATGTWTLVIDPQGPATGTMVIRLT